MRTGESACALRLRLSLRVDRSTLWREVTPFLVHAAENSIDRISIWAAPPNHWHYQITRELRILLSAPAWSEGVTLKSVVVLIRESAAGGVVYQVDGHDFRSPEPLSSLISSRLRLWWTEERVHVRGLIQPAPNVPFQAVVDVVAAMIQSGLNNIDITENADPGAAPIRVKPIPLDRSSNAAWPDSRLSPKRTD